MEHFDLCVIGGGPAGYAAAMRAIDLGLRTVLVERDRIGGTGIFNGALMSKTLWELSQRVTSANEVIRERGRQPFRLSWREISGTMNEAVFERKYLYACHMQLLENAGDRFRHERGTARFTGPHTVMVDRPDARTAIRADHFVIATGSRPRTMPDIRTDERRILSSDGIFAINDLPESIVIVGAGVIGCEFATIFSNFGRTRVHMIDRADRILPFEDADVSGTITRELERKGVIIHHGARLERMEAMPHGVEYTINGPDGRQTVTTELALLSVGRVPNTDGLGLEHAGVERDPTTGAILVKDTCTSVPHIHVAGDATGSHMLVNLGELEGRHAVELIRGASERPLSYDNASTIMFLDPEVAGVGLNEQECVRQGAPCGPHRLCVYRARHRHAAHARLLQAHRHRRRPHARARHACGGRTRQQRHPDGGPHDADRPRRTRTRRPHPPAPQHHRGFAGVRPHAAGHLHLQEPGLR